MSRSGGLKEKMRGHPVQILRAKDNGYELDAKALEHILLAKNIQDKKVVVLSVAGAYRKGKSFLLNFLLRYLEAKGSPQWMGDPEEPLKGFSWQSGWKGHTTGIFMWSEAYIVKTANREEVAVILLDTQGAFDTTCSMGECATVFALSTMVSSVQVYNISQNIEETALHHLQLFVEYGRIAQEKNASNIPFQKLQFLIRDWRYLQDFKYGINGGRAYLDNILSSSGRDKAELQQVRQHIKSSFSDISCFLMPYPGDAVAGDSAFNGKLSGISAAFKTEMEKYVPLLLSPENLVIKHIGGIDVTAKELCSYFQLYITMFQGDKLPTPYTIYEATAHANNQLALKRAKDHYKDKMETICNMDYPLISSKQLDEEHLKLVQSTMILFRSIRKMGQGEITSIYEQELIVDLDAMKTKYKKINEAMHKMEQTKLKCMKETEELTRKMENMETESKTVKDKLKQIEESHSMKNEDVNTVIKSLIQDKERLQQELQEARITGRANQDEIKQTLEKYLTQIERQLEIQKQNERDFRNQKDEFTLKLETVAMEKEILKWQLTESHTMRTMDAMLALHKCEIAELSDKVEKMKIPLCTVS